MNTRDCFGYRVSALRSLSLVAAMVGLALPGTLRSQTPDTRAAVTFSKDIAPILQRSCQECHHADGVAPMSLITYEDVRPYARAIKTRTSLRWQRGAMPPWFV